MKQWHLERATLQGIELEYEVQGTGEEPVVLVHHGVGVDWFRPLLEEPALTDNHCVLSYHRVGYGGSSRCNGSAVFRAGGCALSLADASSGDRAGARRRPLRQRDDCPPTGLGRPGGSAHPRPSGVGAAGAAE